MNQETLFIKNRNGLNMSVRLTRPEIKTALAFIEHGFSGDKDERHMQVLEEELSKRGYMVINIDAIDSLNASESSSKGITFTGHYNDLHDVIEWARGQEWFQEPFALAGHSMGSAAVLQYAKEHPNGVNLLLLLSHPWMNGKDFLDLRALQMSESWLTSWRATGYWDKVSESRGRTLRVPYGFVEDLEQYDFSKDIDKIKARTALIIGDREAPSRLELNRKLLDMLKVRKELIILPDTPHVVARTSENEKTYREALERVLG
jgi:pimeloyl-ACP methyl ester carboxylesterase